MFKSNYEKVNDVEHFVIEYQAENADEKPVLLFVHGGPGLAESLVLWEIQGKTRENISLVFYDERGAGRTFYKSPDGLVSEEAIEADLATMVELVKEKYHKDKIILMGHNYGTVPAIRYVREHPENILCYVGYEQVSNMKEINAVRFARVRELAELSKKRWDVRTVDKYAKITGGTFDKALLKKGQVTKCNVLLSRYNVANGTDKRLMKSLPSSPIYSVDDLRAMLNAPRLSFKLSEYFKQVNLYEEPMDYQVPMCMISGDYDYQYPYKMSQEYEEKITAPMKKMVIVKDGNCDVMLEDGETFWGEILDFVEEATKAQS